jgi:hypothetical protein
MTERRKDSMFPDRHNVEKGISNVVESPQRSKKEKNSKKRTEEPPMNADSVSH